MYNARRSTSVHFVEERECLIVILQMDCRAGFSAGTSAFGRRNGQLEKSSSGEIQRAVIFAQNFRRAGQSFDQFRVE